MSLPAWMKNRRKLRLVVVLLLALGALGGLFVTNQGIARPQLSSIEPAAGGKDAEAGSRDPAFLTVSSPPSSEEAQTALIAGLTAGKAAGEKFRDVVGMREFYEARGFSPLWLNRNGEPNSGAKSVLGVLEVAWTHGLNPLVYHVDKLRKAIDVQSGMTPFELELLLSDAVVRYGRDLTGMRVTPASVGQSDYYWQPPMKGRDILAWVAGQHGSVASALSRLAPQGRMYRKLREELVKTLASPEEQPRAAIRIDGLLKPGSHHAAVPVIRQFLGGGAIPAQGDTYYDDALARRVMAFQEEHGFAPDGIVGPSTQKILNQSRQAKITQLVANLERQRWMDRVKPDKYVMVNIPSATLWAVEKGRSPLQMKVIVGKENRPTNSFKTTITGVRFNPTWTVPPTIKREDYLPKLVDDPEYLSKRGIEIRYEGQTIDPVTIDWSQVSWDEGKKLTMVQQPGQTNPLGRIRILMPNNYNIYLHDTNDRSAFARNARTLSSGCIRVEKPEELANFILADNDGWSTAAMQAEFERGKIHDIRAQNPIPVYLVYNTVWEKEGGRLVFGYDLYDLDDQLMGAIKAINGFQAPENIAEIVRSSGFKAKSGLDYRAASR